MGGTVIVTGGKMAKSLVFVRWFCRAVGAFYTVPCPRTDPEGYIQGLLDIAERENAAFYVPVASPVAALHDSYAKKGLEKLGCQVLHFPPEVTEVLDDKDKFCSYVRDV